MAFGDGTLPPVRSFRERYLKNPCLRNIRERHMGKKITIEQTWHQQSEAATAEAEKLPHGKESKPSKGRPGS
jgi:hypothetical protein